MTTINDPSGTTIDEVGDGLYRITTPVRAGGFAFTFNRYLLVDDEAVLFHTGPRKMASLVIAAVAKVLPLAKVRWISFGHVEADECGALNEILAAAPSAVPLCGSLAARVSMNDLADRAPRELEDGEEIVTGRRRLSWIAAPHVPHARVEVVAGFGRARRGVNARVAVPPGATKSRGVCSDYQTCGISR
jgi:flavorubredoxin